MPETAALTSSSKRVIPRLALAVAAAACVAVQIPGSLCLSALALALWLGLLLVGDRPALARLWLPRFWLLTLAFALGSGLLLGPRASRGLYSVVSAEGLRAGLLMVVRGAFIFALASWASRAVSQEELHRAFRRVGLEGLGSALGVALRLLPDLQATLQGRSAGRLRLRRARERIVELVTEAARLADRLALGARAPARLVAAVTGPPRSGKTTLLGLLLEKLRAGGVEPGGVLQIAELDGDGGHRAVGYRLRALPGGEERPLARRRQARAPGELGFEFADDGWQFARSRIGEARRSRPVVVVDELGKLEAAGQGHLPSLTEAIPGEPPGVLLLAVRADCAEAIAGRLGGFALELRTGADPETVEAFAVRLQELARLDPNPEAKR